uniref:Retrotransposon protein, putative, Ty1-copia subclass n=1 Tax=Tanacetum cinerariifolium TaxID=118510 RepID=A0A6L2NIX2_TANCI|nr:retrotransposon protein, putative, Ty1-copia subclass [Tanacetum cinerariifolium]
MAHPAQNINHSAFRLMFEREKLSGNNFNDWFRQLKLVLKVEKKMYVIEQPIPLLLQLILQQMCWQNEMQYMMLIMRWLVLCSEDGKPVGAYALKMKDYVEQLEQLGYVLLQELSVDLILNGLTSNFAGFVRNYNMHNMRKTIGELHALLEHEQGLPKKATIPQVMVIQGGRIQKANKKSKNLKAKVKGMARKKIKVISLSLKPSAKEHLEKNDAYYHCKEVGHWKKNCHVYLAELMKIKKQVGTTSSSGFFTIELFSFPNKSWVNGIYEIDMSNLVPYVTSIYNDRNKRVKHNLDSTYLWHCHLAHISKKCIEKLQHDGVLKLTDDEYFDQCVSCLSDKMTRKLFPHRPKRVIDLLGLIHTDVCGLLRHVSRQVGGRKTLKKIHDEDTSPSEITSKVPMEVEGFEPPHEEEAPVRRFVRTHRAPERLCLDVEVEEHSFGDLNEPANYKAAMLDSESKRWLDAMNAKMQSIKDNQVWRMVDLPPDCKTVRSKRIFKKKTDMDGIIHTYKAYFVATGYTQLYRVDYEETFSPVADIRAIRILIAIAAYYDYEIWQMDVKTSFLNGYLAEDIYMLQPKDFVDPKHTKNMDTSKRGYIPIQERLDLNKIQGASTPGKVKRMQNVPYALAVGEPHWTAVKTILNYLRNTKDMFLVYGVNPKAELRVDCYCDVGFETDRDDAKSQTGYVFILNGGTMDWKSSKQSTTMMSAT